MKKVDATSPPTARQAEVLGYIDGKTKADGFPPSFREIGKALGIGSPSGVASHVRLLMKKGLVESTTTLARTLRVTERGKAWLRNKK